MALKDWNLDTEAEKLMQWYNPKTRVSVFVYEQDFIPELKKKSYWVFEVGTSSRTIKEVKSSSKSNATSKAKAYMRSH